MPATREVRHPDFGGLLLQRDPVHPAALVAVNFEVTKPGILAKRGGIRRVNHRRYSGAIFLLDDLQRICDFRKFLVIGGDEVYEHGDGTGGTIDDPFFAPAYPPVAAASGAPLAGVAPLAVQFSSAGSWDPNGGTLAYAWDFGDGNTSTDANPGHTYAGAGNYTVTLTVTNSAGLTATDGLNVVASAGIVYLLWDGVGLGNWKAGP